MQLTIHGQVKNEFALYMNSKHEFALYMDNQKMIYIILR